MITALALAQFVASYSATAMNVAISSAARDLGTTVAGIQTAITLVTLTTASLIIPGSKLTDLWGRRRCFTAGLLAYGAGALLAALAPGLGTLIAGFSVLEGAGSALMIPPAYILITVAYPDVRSRARSFGVISGASGLGTAAGPLLGGLLTSTVSWRASFALQVALVAVTAWLARRIPRDRTAGTRGEFDLPGAVLSAAGMFLVVLGVLLSRTYGWLQARHAITVLGTVIIPAGDPSPIWIFIGSGLLVLSGFVLHIRARQERGKEPLVPVRVFLSRPASLGMATQAIQWLVVQGAFFVVAVYLQRTRGYSAIQTGLILTPATAGILAASAAAGRLARRHRQRTLIIAGFTVTLAGMVLLVTLAPGDSGILSFVHGLGLMGLGVGVMLTASVNVVQSSFPDRDQADVSGLSRCVADLGASLGTALVGSVLVTFSVPHRKPFAISLALLVAFALIGLVTAVFLPRASRDAPGAR